MDWTCWDLGLGMLQYKKTLSLWCNHIREWLDAFLIFSLPQTRVLIDDLREVTQGGKSKLGGDSRTLLRVLCHRNDSDASHYVKKHFKIPSSAPPSSWSGKSGNASKVYNGWNNGWLCNPGIISCSYVLVIFVHYYLLAVGSREAYTSSDTYMSIVSIDCFCPGSLFFVSLEKV
jgi:hypothetical protein